MATATTRDVTATGATAAPSTGLRPYRITVDVYERIVASGAFGDKSSIFLWKGQLVEQVRDMTIGRPHVYAVTKLDSVLGRLLPDGWFVEQDQPMEVGDDSVPEPDLKVVRGAPEDFLRRTPSSQDVPLVIGVSNSRLSADSGEMLRAYAEALIPVYWIVNLPENRIDVYTRPGRPAGTPCYEENRSFIPGDEVPVVLDGREVGRVAVKDVLP